VQDAANGAETGPLFSFELMIVHGATRVSVASSISLRASVYSSYLVTLTSSIGDIFHCLSGSSRRSSKRSFCRPCDTVNHILNRWIPLLTSDCSKSGTWRRNRACSWGVQKPITFSTPARLYQDRSNIVISPADGRCGDVALEVPLGHFGIVGLRQRDVVATARVQVLAEALDRSTLARRVAPLEHDHHALIADSLDVPLRLEQFDLEQFEVALVVLLADRFVVGQVFCISSIVSTGDGDDCFLLMSSRFVARTRTRTRDSR
jgi:hypothetical protein